MAGDGIGPEVTAQSRRVARMVRGQTRRSDRCCARSCSASSAWQAHRQPDARGDLDEIVDADAILFGATGGPEYDKIPAEARKVDSLLRMRSELDLFANLRPVRTPMPALADLDR